LSRALLLGLLGLSFNFVLPVRAARDPMINEGDATCESAAGAAVAIYTLGKKGCPALADNLTRKQYQKPPVTERQAPLRDQFVNYFQYFDWQWSNSLSTTEAVFARARLPFTMIFTSLGIYGATVLRHKNRSAFWLLVLLFAITGPGLVAYMNFKPGFSIGFDAFPNYEMHEVRERDYFFLVSYQVWGLFTGIGVAGLYRLIKEKLEAALPHRHRAHA